MLKKEIFLSLCLSCIVTVASNCTASVVVGTTGGLELWVGTNKTIIDSSGSFADVASGDFDGDGMLDVMAVKNGGLVWYEWNNTSKSFESRGSVSTAPSTTYVTVEMGDFDGNGKADLFAGGDTMAVWGGSTSNDTPGTFYTINSNASWQCKAISVGDFDGNGTMDVFTGAYGNTSADQIDWFKYNSGNANKCQWVATVDRDEKWDSLSPIEDYDGDGHMDLFGGRDNRTYRFENTGIGTVSLITAPWNGGEYASSFAFGDIDGDGEKDMVMSLHSLDSDTTVGGLYWYEGEDASGVPQLVMEIQPQDVGAWNDVILTDIDGDGITDIIAARDASLERFEWNGNGFDRSVLSEENSTSLVYVDVIPEPATMCLLACGAGALLTRGRRVRC